MADWIAKSSYVIPRLSRRSTYPNSFVILPNLFKLLSPFFEKYRLELQQYYGATWPSAEVIGREQFMLLGEKGDVACDDCH
jgi:hypothetical protein